MPSSVALSHTPSRDRRTFRVPLISLWRHFKPLTLILCSYLHGMGMSVFTFDWSQIAYVYVSVIFVSDQKLSWSSNLIAILDLLWRHLGGQKRTSLRDSFSSSVGLLLGFFNNFSKLSSQYPRVLDTCTSRACICLLLALTLTIWLVHEHLVWRIHAVSHVPSHRKHKLTPIQNLLTYLLRQSI